MRRVRWIGVVLVALVVAVGGWLHIRSFAPDPGRYSVRGVDVSHRQGEIDWARGAMARRPWTDCVVWQFGDTGTVAGIEGPVDLGVLAGPLGDLLSAR